jgi:hypothetical protein
MQVVKIMMCVYIYYGKRRFCVISPVTDIRNFPNEVRSVCAPVFTFITEPGVDMFCSEYGN